MGGTNTLFGDIIYILVTYYVEDLNYLIYMHESKFMSCEQYLDDHPTNEYLSSPKVQRFTNG